MSKEVVLEINDKVKVVVLGKQKEERKNVLV
jgi:hypothetical protein